MKKLFVSGAAFMFVSNLAMFFIKMDTSIWIAAAINVVRSISIGCLMMPLVTWGAHYVNKEMTTHATALLTSLRTIAGAVGAAVFVGIMTMVADNSMETYGKNASMHGLNIAFLVMAACTLVMLLTAVFGVRNSKQKMEK